MDKSQWQFILGQDGRGGESCCCCGLIVLFLWHQKHMLCAGQPLWGIHQPGGDWCS